MTRRLKDMTEPELTEYFNLLASATESVLPDGPSKNGRALFCLLVFEEDLIGHYVANCQRAEMIKVLRETADRLESNEDVRR